MAASDARPIPKKNTAYRLYAPLWDADGDLVTGAAALDSEVSIDGGTFADCTNEATEIATASGVYFLDLTAAEMNGDAICVIIKTGTAGAKTTPIILYPEEAGDIRVDVTMISGDATAADNLEAYTDGTTPMPVNATQIEGSDATNQIRDSILTDATRFAGANIDAAISSRSTYAGGAVASVTGNVGGNVVGSVASVTAGVTVTTNNDKAGYGLSAAAVQAIWDALTAALTTAGSIGKLLVDNINATIGSRSTVTTAQINAEVLDVLNVDTFAEPAAAPAATTTLQAMLHWLFTLARNERRTTATSDLVRNDANGATIGTATLSDDNTTFTRGEYS